jgi:hypothetical protein
MDDLLTSTVNTVKGPGSGGSLDQRLDHIIAVLIETKTICEQSRKESVTLSKAKSSTLGAVLRILDIYPGSRILILPIPDLGSRIQKQQQKRGVKKNLLS